MAITISGSGITSANIADGTITTDDILASDVNNLKSGRKNLIINGGMQVAQRGTTGSLVGGPSYVALDRWRLYIDTSSTIYSTQTPFPVGQSDVDKNLEFYNRFDWLGTGTAQTKTISQRIEGVHWGNGQVMTISFWGRTEQADDVTVKVNQGFGSGGSSSVIATQTVVDLSTSWAKYSVTFSMPSISGKTLGASPYINVEFGFGPSTLNSYFDFTGVQLELGSVATDFEHRSYGEELALCQRYYQIARPRMYETSAGGNHTTSETIDHPVQLRTTPSVGYDTLLGTNINGTYPPSQMRNTKDTYSFRVIASASGLVDYSPTITFDAEL